MEPLAFQHGPRAGVDRYVLDGDPNLAGFELYELIGHNLKVIGRRRPFGTLLEHYSMIQFCHREMFPRRGLFTTTRDGPTAKNCSLKDEANS